MRGLLRVLQRFFGRYFLGRFARFGPQISFRGQICGPTPPICPPIGSSLLIGGPIIAQIHESLERDWRPLHGFIRETAV